MRTTVTIDDRLFAELMRLTGAESRSEAINRALADWIAQQRIERLKELAGKVVFEGDLATLRAAELEESDGLE